MNYFFLYARKSTDEPDRQILSIEAQITELREFAAKEQINIVKTFIENQTAKEPGRPIFNEMIKRIESGEAEGILAWHPDRLARNSVDGGKIIYLLDTGKIKQLKFPTFWFESTPQGKFMLNIAFGQSKYYVDNLSENVKRGLRQKVRRGEYPGVAPTGYLNDKLNHKMVKDPVKYPLIQKMFKLYATGNYTLNQLRETMTEAGLTSRSGKPLSISNIHLILANPFYYGAFMYAGELHQGAHEPAITKKLFDKVQQVLKDRGRPKIHGKHIYPFRGLFKCAECGCAITSETQKGHNYYRCTKKRIPCLQPYIREEMLSEQISTIIQKVSLSSASARWMLTQLDKEKQEKAEAELSFAQNLKKEIAEHEQKLEKLLDAQLAGIITTEEYTAKKQKILNHKIELSQNLEDFERKGNRWLELSRQFILTSKQAKIIALQGNFSAKKNFLKKIGSNLKLQERRVLILPKNPWKILFDADLAAGNLRSVLADLRDLDSNQDARLQRPVSYH